MLSYIEEQKRIEKYMDAVRYMLDNDTSLRKAAENCMISKSTLHRFIHKELVHIDLSLFDDAIILLKKNKREVNNFKRFPRPEPRYRIANIVGSNWK